MGKSAITKAEFEGAYLLRGDKKFRRVFNANATEAMTFGQAVYTKYGKSEEVIVCDTAASGLPSYAGRVSDANDYLNEAYTIPAQSWGTVLMWGEGLAEVEGTDDIAAGDSLKGVNAQKYMVKDQAAGTEASYYSHDIALEAFTTDDMALKKVFVRARG